MCGTSRPASRRRARRRHAARALFAPLVVALLVSTPAARAKEWFVAPGATGNGEAATPFGSIQAGIDAAQPGDIVTVLAGTYAERLQTVRSGSASSPIQVRAAAGAPVSINLTGELLQVDHAHFVLEGIILDGNYADADLIDVNDGATGLVLRNCEVRRATRDCIDMGAPADVVIEGCKIHHCLNAAGGQTDAHGVTGGAVRGLVIRNTEIHTFSGDAIQFDPGRALPGWNDIRVEGCKLWTGPLASAENGFSIGTVTGENAIDTKTNAAAPRAKLTIVNTSAWGFRGGLITNMAAFNIKENVDAAFDGVTVFDSEIAFRTRGPGANGGAWVRVQNAVVYDVDKAVRYEDDIERLAVLSATFGADVLEGFEAASAPATVPDVRNLLVLGASLPSQAAAPSSSAVVASAFVDVAAADYHLAAGSPAVDRGEAIAGVTSDRDGVSRPQGAAYDIGAYERCAASACVGAGGSAGAATGGTSAAGAGGSSGAATGGIGGSAMGGTSGATSGAGGSMTGGTAGAAGGVGGSVVGGTAGGAPGAGATATAGNTGVGAANTAEESGCGCRIGRAAPRTAWLFSFATAFALARRRRRRR